MSKHNDRAYADHIRAAATSMQAHIRGMTFDAFTADTKTQHAVLYELAVIGEAAGNLSDQFQKDHPQVPWRDIVGMRNAVIHEYFGVDLGEVWRTVTRDVPDLLSNLATI